MARREGTVLLWRRRHHALQLHGVWALWLVLGSLVVVYAGHEAFGFSSSLDDELFRQGLNDVLIWAAAGVCLVGALRTTRSRTAWLLVSAGLASWAIGDTIWSIRYGGSAQGPLTSVSDVFWLAWYPLVLTALVLLVRDRVPKFELHRWIDGVVVMLIVATPWIAVFLQPVAAHSGTSALADAVDFAYPLGDAIVVGATLGAFALMGWRPGRMWVTLGIGLVAIGIADAVYSVQALEHTYRGGLFDAAWAGGAVLVAYAAWFPHPGQVQPRQVSGWPAVALPIAAQVFAITIQVYGIFASIPNIERGLTIVVLLIAIVQIAITKPVAEPDDAPVPP
ncbi:MAG TPA: hypothetical protein VGU73_09710 [Acidimicrobiia bacterium]|nr:hypothetical protein [Acidimicrobiia bacterium]